MKLSISPRRIKDSEYLVNIFGLWNYVYLIKYICGYYFRYIFVYYINVS